MDSFNPEPTATTALSLIFTRERFQIIERFLQADQNVLTTLYYVLGIDPATTLLDHTGRPIYLLDDRRRIEELA